jgi:hypothetical protein
MNYVVGISIGLAYLVILTVLCIRDNYLYKRDQENMRVLLTSDTDVTLDLE